VGGGFGWGVVPTPVLGTGFGAVYWCLFGVCCFWGFFLWWLLLAWVFWWLGWFSPPRIVFVFGFVFGWWRVRVGLLGCFFVWNVVGVE